MWFSGHQPRDEDSSPLRTDVLSLQTGMSVVTESVMAPHEWLRYDVKRIRSVRHLTDLGLRLSKALSCTNKAAWLVGRRGDRGRGGVGRIPFFLVTLVLILGVRVFGEDPRGEVRVVQVPAEPLDGLFVDHVLRSAR